MKLADDNRTIELPLGLEPTPAPIKRGRGRPKLENPKSAAQRASDYRKRKKFLAAKEQNALPFSEETK